MLSQLVGCITGRIVLSSMLVAIAVFQSSCVMADAMVLRKIREYFPAAYIVKPRPDVLHIETGVGNISGVFAMETFAAMHDRNGSQLRTAMDISGYKVLVIGFNECNVVWVPQQGRNFAAMPPFPYAMWYTKAFGVAMQTDYARAQIIR